MLLLILLVSPSVAAPDIHVTGIRYWTAPDHTRVVLDLQGEYSYRVSTRDDPQRIVIDVQGGDFRCSTEARKVGDELVQLVRCNELRGGAQVVLDLSSKFKYRYFALDPIPGRKPKRIVVDVYPETRGAPGLGAEGEAQQAGDGQSGVSAGHVPAGEKASGDAEPVSGETPGGSDDASKGGQTPGRASPPTAPSAQPKPAGLREIVVVIDPGHGGEDPGAIYRGIREKKLTLNIAKRVKRKIDALPGYRAVLTRSGDYYVGLAQRRRMADKEGGDLLVSIHSNTAPNRAARGVEVFYLSTKGASSREAQAVADLENRSDLVGGVHPSASEAQVKLVLGERLERSIEHSKNLAMTFWKEARRDKQLVAQRRVKRANFAVCKMLSMPSVLVEVGFMTNAKDRQLLSTDEGKDHLATWLARSIETYFRKYPETLYDPLFSRKEKLMYKVRRGDTLSRIATKFGVSVQDLIRANRINRADRIAVGELLLVVGDVAQPLIHKVCRGENLSGIARRYGVTVESLQETNKLRRVDLLHPGQELIILPVGAGGG